MIFSIEPDDSVSKDESNVHQLEPMDRHTKIVRTKPAELLKSADSRLRLAGLLSRVKPGCRHFWIELRNNVRQLGNADGGRSDQNDFETSLSFEHFLCRRLASSNMTFTTDLCEAKRIPGSHYSRCPLG
jgi:hypothetical protein